MRRAFACFAVWAGACSYPTTATKRFGVLGYATPPKVAIASRGAADLIKPWASTLRLAGGAEIVGEVESPPPPEHETITPDATLCELARTLASPIDEIVEITSSEAVESHSQCTRSKCHTPDPVGEGTSGEPVCGCVDSRYDGTTVRASVALRLVHARTCTRAAVLAYDSPARTLASDPATDRDSAHQLVAAALANVALARAPEVFPAGRGIQRVDGRTIEIANDTQPAIVPGGLYWLHTRRAPDVRAHVVRADAHAATLEVDAPRADVEPGDELHVTHYVRRATVYGSLGGGIARTSRTDVQVGASVAMRMSFDRYPVMGEFQVAADTLPALAIDRAGGGFAGGLRWPYGPFDPVVFAELGIAKAYQKDATSTGGYLGVGGGVELWLEHWFVFGDARWRRYFMQDWTVTVPHPDLDAYTTTVQLGFGRVY